MTKTLYLLGWGLLIMAHSFLMLITISGWGQHALSFWSGYWFPLKEEDNLQSLSTSYLGPNALSNGRLLEVQDDISGVSKVLILDAEPEVSIYFNSRGDIIATRLGIASVLSGFDPSSVARLSILLAIGLILFSFSRGEPRSTSVLSALSYLVFSFVLCDLSGQLLVHYPLFVWGMVGGLSLLLASFTSSCVAFETWYWGRKRQQVLRA